jgi:hypothetical protein
MPNFLRIAGSAHEWHALTDDQVEEIMCAGGEESPLVGREHDIPTKVMMGFLDGYHCGLTWPDKWEHDPYSSSGKPNPGGPWVSQMRHPKETWRYIVDPVSQSTNAAWKRGWRYGHDLKLATGRSNPMRSQ